MSSLKDQFNGFLNTPPLWKNRALFGLKQFELPEFHNFIHLDPLKEIPSLSSNFVLGKRMESFFELVIRHSKRYNITAANQQIFKDNITIGEVDFLVEDVHYHQNLHIELVYKFYIYDPSYPQELQRWIGPNRKDSLLQKIQKLKQDQLPLLFKTETRNWLSSHDLDAGNLEQMVCFKANLFLPVDWHHTLPFVNEECIAGYWIQYIDFRAEIYSEFQFFSPKKQDWPSAPENQEEWRTFSQIQKEILFMFQRKKSPLVWMRKPGGVFERFFVVWW